MAWSPQPLPNISTLPRVPLSGMARLKIILLIKNNFGFISRTGSGKKYFTAGDIHASNSNVVNYFYHKCVGREGKSSTPCYRNRNTIKCNLVRFL